jgi:hypothetical protein
MIEKFKNKLLAWLVIDNSLPIVDAREDKLNSTEEINRSFPMNFYKSDMMGMVSKESEYLIPIVQDYIPFDDEAVLKLRLEYGQNLVDPVIRCHLMNICQKPTMQVSKTVENSLKHGSCVDFNAVLSNTRIKFFGKL